MLARVTLVIRDRGVGARVAEYLPWLPAAWAQFSVRHCAILKFVITGTHSG